MYKCSNLTLKWMTSYLYNRTQMVSIGKHQSNMVSLDRGGALLFLVYTNEIPEILYDSNCTLHVPHTDKTRRFGNNCVKCGTIVSYADDLTLVVSSRKREQNQMRLNLNLARLECFLGNNELCVNVSKTAILECMISQKRGKTPGDPPHLMVVNEEKPGELLKIKDSSNFRVLGSNFQANMSWKAHLEAGKRAVLPAIRKQLGGQLPRHSRKALAEGLLLSKLSYLILYDTPCIWHSWASWSFWLSTWYLHRYAPSTLPWSWIFQKGIMC